MLRSLYFRKRVYIYANEALFPLINAILFLLSHLTMQPLVSAALVER